MEILVSKDSKTSEVMLWVLYGFVWLCVNNIFRKRRKKNIASKNTYLYILQGSKSYNKPAPIFEWNETQGYCNADK